MSIPTVDKVFDAHFVCFVHFVVDPIRDFRGEGPLWFTWLNRNKLFRVRTGVRSPCFFRGCPEIVVVLDQLTFGAGLCAEQQFRRSCAMRGQPHRFVLHIRQVELVVA